MRTPMNRQHTPETNSNRGTDDAAIVGSSDHTTSVL